VVKLSSGRIGRASSSDGLLWQRTDGPEGQGSALDVNKEAWWGFDTSHIGMGDMSLNMAEGAEVSG